MLNHDLYFRDPREWSLANKGVTRVNEPGSDAELLVLKNELETFVCEGEYARGMEAILHRYLDNLGRESQPGVWVSGFYGSGKSHFVKMLRALWTDHHFAVGATARGLVKNLPHGVSDNLRELSNRARQIGTGLHAASGTLSSTAGNSVRLAVVKVVFESLGFDSSYPVGRFELWLRDEGLLDDMRAAVVAKGLRWENERKNFYVSKVIAEALLARRGDLASDVAGLRKVLIAQFSDAKDINTEVMVGHLRGALQGRTSELPLTLIVLDEVQQFIAENTQRGIEVQEVAESLQKQFDARVLLVATGQSAMNDKVPALEKIQARFPLSIPLSDQDVEQVIRKVVLLKAPTASAVLEKTLDGHLTEIAKQLPNATVRHRDDDRKDFAADYPVLPSRRRFWERCLRAVDRAGVTAQLRNQLSLTHEAARATANQPLGHVVGADFVIENQEVNLLNAGVLPRSTHEKLQRWRGEGERGVLKSRVGALAFVIAKLPRDKGADIGVRANSADIADLLVTDLGAGAQALRPAVVDVLAEMDANGDLMLVDGEYRWQTRESAVWDQAYRSRLGELKLDLPKYQQVRADLLRETTRKALDKKLKLLQGNSNVERDWDIHTSEQPPKVDGSKLWLWLRDEWSTTWNELRATMLALGVDSPVVAILLPRSAENDLYQTIPERDAAQAVLDSPPQQVGSDAERDEARKAMESRKVHAEARLAALLRTTREGARVLLGGAKEIAHPTGAEDPFVATVKDAGVEAIQRLFPQFGDADHAAWDKVLRKAREGDSDALKAVGHTGDVQTHKVAVAMLKSLGAGKTGKELRTTFTGTPYGWPQDAIDAVLFTLLASGQLRAMESNAPVALKNLDVRKLGTVTLQRQKVVASVQEKGTVKALLAELGVSVKVNEEAAALATLFDQMEKLAARAGGEAPKPVAPAPDLITSLRKLVDQELLVDVAVRADEIRKTHKLWKETASAIEVRTPRWDLLVKLVAHARGLDGIDGPRAQVDAVRDGRLLLRDPDPVPPLVETFAGRLRTELAAAVARYTETWSEGDASLAADAEWQQLDEPTRSQILKTNGLTGVPSVKTGTPDEVERALGERSLSAWQTQRDALPTRFAQARLDAAKRLVPEAVAVKLPSRTLRDEAEVAAWVGEVRALLEAGVKRGPVIV